MIPIGIALLLLEVIIELVVEIVKVRFLIVGIILPRQIVVSGILVVVRVAAGQQRGNATPPACGKPRYPGTRLPGTRLPKTGLTGIGRQ